MGIAGLDHGLTALGHRVTHLRPRTRLPSLLLTRLNYNLELPRRLAQLDGVEMVVGFDWDGVFLPRPARPAAPRYVVGVKGTLSDEARFERGLTRWRLQFQARMEQRNAARADRVITPSRYSHQATGSSYRLQQERMRVVPEGIHLHQWHTPDNALPYCQRPLRILSVAQQYPRKNTTTLIAAMRQVCQQVPGAHLHIVGGGPQLAVLTQQVARLGLQQQVRFLGSLPCDRTVRAQYHTARVFCLPSRQESFGIVFLEAMAAGLPVVAADCAAVPELIDPHVGTTLPGTDSDALADALIRLLQHPKDAQRLGEAGRKRAANYDWPLVAGRFIDAVTDRA